MFVALLKFSDNKAAARQHMEGHNAWIQRGIEDGIFLVVGSLQPNAGGAIVAHNVDRPTLESRLTQDPFVENDVVRAEILEIVPARVDERLGFLMD